MRSPTNTGVRPMGISQYLKVIGRGKVGARNLPRDQATDLMGQVLDGTASDLEVGAFCIAMRIRAKRRKKWPVSSTPCTSAWRCCPPAPPARGAASYNGARKLPVLTPLLALLLARNGLPVLVHGTATEDRRVSSQDVLAALDIAPCKSWTRSNPVTWPSSLPALLPGLERLLDVRRTLGLRTARTASRQAHGPALARGGRQPYRGQLRTPNTPSPWPPPSLSRGPMPCCCAAPRASQWPIPPHAADGWLSLRARRASAGSSRAAR